MPYFVRCKYADGIDMFLAALAPSDEVYWLPAVAVAAARASWPRPVSRGRVGPPRDDGGCRAFINLGPRYRSVYCSHRASIGEFCGKHRALA